MRKIKTSPISQEQRVLLAKWDNYKGRIVAVMGKKIYSATSGEEAKKMIAGLEKKYRKSPLITYIPKADTLI